MVTLSHEVKLISGHSIKNPKASYGYITTTIYSNRKSNTSSFSCRERAVYGMSLVNYMKLTYDNRNTSFRLSPEAKAFIRKYQYKQPGCKIMFGMRTPSGHHPSAITWVKSPNEVITFIGKPSKVVQSWNYLICRVAMLYSYAKAQGWDVPDMETFAFQDNMLKSSYYALKVYKQLMKSGHKDAVKALDKHSNGPKRFAERLNYSATYGHLYPRGV